VIGDNELQREARRILRKLQPEHSVLERFEDGRFTITHDGKPDRAHTRVAPEFVAAFRSRDWIAPRGTTPESFSLSDAGAAWLRRSLADGDPFAAQHRVIAKRLVIDPEGIECVVNTNELESPVTWLKARKIIDAVQCEAGERLRRDYTLAQLSPRLGVDFTAPIVLGQRGTAREATITETALAAKQRFARAMKTVGPGLSDLLFDVCCHLIGLEDAERQFGWPLRAGKVVLAIALDRLALHYGLKITGPRHAPMRSWQAD
jgi:hypothetical protein